MDYIPADTTPDAYRKQIEILRKMSPGERAMLAFELSDSIRENAISGIRHQHPEYTTEQIRNELLRRLVGAKMFRKIAAAKGLEYTLQGVLPKYAK